MKSTTFARLALSLPYLVLIESVMYFVFYDINEKNSLIQTFNLLWNYLAIFWFLPYTVLVMILLFQSKGKSFAEVKRLFMWALLWLMAIAPVTYVAIFVIGTIIDSGFFEDMWRLLVWAMTVSIPASVLLGYAFLGISLLLHKLLSRVGVIKDNNTTEAYTEDQNQISES